MHKFENNFYGNLIITTIINAIGSYWALLKRIHYISAGRKYI
jgi:hypothetical protein